MMWTNVRAVGWAYWVLVTCNLAIPLTTLWSRKLRTNIAFMFFIFDCGQQRECGLSASSLS